MRRQTPLRFAAPTRRAIVLGLASLPSATLAQPVLSVRDFGARPDGSDAGPGLARACEALARKGGGRLLIPEGVYRVAQMEGAALRLEGLTGAEIFAVGAELRLEGLCRAVYARHCNNLRVVGLAVDWRRPPFSQGDVAAISRGGLEIEVALDALTPWDGWTQVKAIGAYDRATGLLTRRQVDAYDCVETVEGLSPRRARLKLSREIGLEGAETLVLRHATYESNALEFAFCRDLEVNLVKVRTGPGMALHAWRCSNVTLSGVDVSASPGRLMSSVSDAAHFLDCDGDIRVEACRFSAMGDDGLNVHGTYWRVVERKGREFVVAKPFEIGFSDEEMPASGARFTLVSGTTLEKLGVGRVSGARLTGARATIALADEPPAEFGVGDAMIETDRATRLAVRFCRFGGNRARGVLAHSHVTIEDCVFRDMSLEAILLIPDLTWQEGPEAAHVRIARNVIVGANRWGTDGGAVRVDAIVNGGKTTAGHPNSDITLEDNVIRGSKEPAVVLRGL